MTDRPTLDTLLRDPRFTALSPAKRELMLKKLGLRPDAQPQAAIPKRDGADSPLSFAQELLWVQHQMDPAAGAYHVPLAWRVRGPLDEPALQCALDALVVRHEVLRSVVELIDGEPRLRPAAVSTLSVERTDLSELAPSVREADLAGLLDELAARPFALDRDLPLRAALVTLDAETRVLALVAHHIAMDGWSMGVLRKELSALYAAARRSQTSLLPPLPVQYGDFAAWQRSELRGERLERLLSYWRERLGQGPVPLDLASDRARSAAAASDGARAVALLPAELVARLREFARGRQATLFMVLLAGYKALLARYAGVEDVVVGSPVAGRRRSELEGMIGYLGNTLVLRTSVAGDPSFAELLDRVRETSLGALEHQDVPFEALALDLRRDRTRAAVPLFETIFVLQNQERGALRLEGVEVEIHPWERRRAAFDLSLSVSESESGARVVAEYRTALFDAATVQRMLGHYTRLLEGAVAEPATAVAALPLLDDAELRLLESWGESDAGWPEDATIHGLFEAQAHRRPDAIAVECGDARITYGELDRRADRLAAALQRCGVGPDRLVAVCLERSADVIVALLGVLKAGGAYVPIDPAYPEERIAYMLADAAPVAVIAESATRSRLPAEYRDALLADDDWASVAGETAPAPAAVRGDHLAYVIYTSGSTGRPKGVMVEHRNVVRLLRNDRFQFDFDERDVWSVFHSFAFDFSVWEMYGALLFGGRAVVVPKVTAQDPAEFLALLRRAGVTVLNQVPTAFYALMHQELQRPAADLRVRWVIFGGEALQPALLRLWRERYPATRLANMFGITETTVHVTFKEIGEAEIAAGISNIGRPIPTLSTYVLDRELRRVPIGVPGELCVGGLGVARGYLNRPELTAERFVPHPFRSGERLYRSGDIARWLAVGELEYLGRRDDQVKIRGFRIELGEIEAALLAHPGVRECAVIARQDTPGDQRLVAYVVPGDDAAPGAVALREHLRARLPEHMVPAAVVALDQLPMTGNGKLDRRALPAPALELADRHVAPRSAVERAVAGGFAEVLHVRRVGAHDSFFELGGHSLLVTQLVARLARIFRVHLPLRLVFEQPTVAAVAEALVAREPQPGLIARIAELLEKVESMSADEARQRLSAPSVGSASGA